MHIYKTTNLVNGKIYIGLTRKNNLEYLGSGKLILRAIKKYGKDNFKRVILEECNNLEELNMQEIFWIAYYNSIDPKIGYNILLGGNSYLDYEAISLRMSKRWADPEYKKMMKEIFLNSWKDNKERKLNMSISVKNRWKNEEFKLHMINCMRNILLSKWSDKTSIYNSKEFREKISKSISVIWANPNSLYNSVEYRKKLSIASKKWMNSPKGKKMASDNMKKVNGEKGFWFGKKRSADTRKKMSLARKGIKLPPKSEATKKKISDSLKGNIPWNKGKINIYSAETIKKMSESAKTRSQKNEKLRRQKISMAQKDKSSGAKPIYDSRDGKIYKSIREFCSIYSLTEYKYKKLLKAKIIKHIKNNT